MKAALARIYGASLDRSRAVQEGDLDALREAEEALEDLVQDVTLAAYEAGAARAHWQRQGLRGTRPGNRPPPFATWFKAYVKDES